MFSHLGTRLSFAMDQERGIFYWVFNLSDAEESSDVTNFLVHDAVTADEFVGIAYK